ncbi:hypothetical protein HY839_03090 [Candidatus Azambacteria bacterium]|nr:hypothetical protein [Candidatus Azambacteria bacterium]
MKIGDDKAARFGTKMIWWGVMLIIILVLYQCGNRLITQFAKADNGPPSPVGHIEDGLLIKPVGNVLKQQVHTQTTRKEEAGGNIVYIKTNCYHITDSFITIPPRKSVKIDHIVMSSPMENRCSYNVVGDAAPISGNPGQVIRPKVANNVPFDDMPPEAMVFSIAETQAHDYIKREGGSLILSNPFDMVVSVDLSYNRQDDSPLDTGPNQRGWDGSTVTFRATIF